VFQTPQNVMKWKRTYIILIINIINTILIWNSIQNKIIRYDIVNFEQILEKYNSDNSDDYDYITVFSYLVQCHNCLGSVSSHLDITRYDFKSTFTHNPVGP